MQRLSTFLALALFALPLAAQAAPFQFFHYKNAKGLSRICRGDTATGEAICADGTAVSADTIGEAAPAWETSAKAQSDFLLYRSPFEKPGAYQFFAYDSNQGAPRVCVGDTATGEARCADGASHFASVKGVEKPAWQVDAKAKVMILRYFSGKKQGKAGAYGFGAYYSTKGAVRICQLETSKGVAVCADSTTASAERVGDGKLGAWDVLSKGRSTHFRYFEQL